MATDDDNSSSEMFLSCLVCHPWNPFSYQHVSVGYVLDSSVLVSLPVALGSADAERVQGSISIYNVIYTNKFYFRA